MTHEQKDLEIARITIVKTLADDDVVITTTYSDGLALVDALGMLAFSQGTAVFDALDEEDG